MKKKLNKKNIFYIFIFFLIIILFFYKFLFNNQKQENKIYKKNIINKNILNKEKTKDLKEDFYKKFNLKIDNSITKFVSKNVSFQNKKYIPKNLEEVEHIFIYTHKEHNEKLRKIAKDALIKLSIEFSKKFNTELKVVSGYRSYEQQKLIENSACEKNLCAKAGYSEHQTGLAIDLWQASDKENFLKNKLYKEYFEWMNDNAYKFGFINTYKKGEKIDSYDIEPWHWRYVGKELALFLHKNNLSFAEFYKKAEK